MSKIFGRLDEERTEKRYKGMDLKSVQETRTVFFNILVQMWNRWRGEFKKLAFVLLELSK